VNVAAAIDPHTISRGIDTRAGNNTINHEDTHVDALIDRMREAETEESYLQAGYAFQRYVVQNMLTTSVSSYAHLQAARSYVKGYENLHGYKLRFETTWLDKQQRCPRGTRSRGRGSRCRWRRCAPGLRTPLSG
jgi:ABC-type oligopeptide transport system substrate-binding subunit